jgi:geranylgeranyl pyrophosphate synthase
MNLDSLRALVLELPEVQGWPDLREFYEYGLSLPRGDWEWPLLACRAVGGDVESAAPVAAALTCMQLSITLVDDMLDHDPRGLHVRIGEGRTANIAFALQAAAYHLVHRSALELAVKEVVAACLARMALGTAYGQHLDVQNLEGEENYWRTLLAKSGPFYGSGMEMGALAGGATAQTASELGEFGTLNGEIIQIYDDLTDALQTPANPDWLEKRPNLAILFALNADHPLRGRFVELRDRSAETQALAEAQKILMQSGALSYCAYHVVRRIQAARNMLEHMTLADRSPLLGILSPQTQPIVTLLKKAGAPIADELAALIP